MHAELFKQVRTLVESLGFNLARRTVFHWQVMHRGKASLNIWPSKLKTHEVSGKAGGALQHPNEKFLLDAVRRYLNQIATDESSKQSALDANKELSNLPVIPSLTKANITLEDGQVRIVVSIAEFSVSCRLSTDDSRTFLTAACNLRQELINESDIVGNGGVPAVVAGN